jgi:hypothetical protein
VSGPDVTGVEEYAEKAAREAITESEARAIALQGIVELSRGVDIAVSEIRKGLFTQAAETLLLAKAGCVVAEAAIQKIRTDEARAVGAAEERERIAAAIEAWRTECIDPSVPQEEWAPGFARYISGLDRAARVARGEAS